MILLRRFRSASGIRSQLTVNANHVAMFARTLGSTSRLVSQGLASSSRTTPARLSTEAATSTSALSSIPEVAPVQRPIILSFTQPLRRNPSDPKHDQHVVSLDPTVFNHPIRRDILHLCVTHYRDSLRQGSASTKTRGEVAGSGRKIRPQKGSGKARLGDAQSPMLVGGGRAFGPKPRDFSTKLPRKVIQMGMRIALSARMREQRLGVTTSMNWPSGKTGPLSRKIDELGFRKTLFVTGEEKPSVGLRRAIANIPSIKLVAAKDANVYEILYWQRIILDVKAVEYFEETLKKDVPILPLPLLESPSA